MPQDRKCWFSDSDIDQHLSRIIRREGHILTQSLCCCWQNLKVAIYPIWPKLLSHLQLYTALLILLMNIRFFLYIVKRLYNFCTLTLWKKPYKPLITLPLITNLNYIFGLKTTVVLNPYAIPRYQDNGFDCGPLVCAYSMYICYIDDPDYNISVNKIFITRIRNEIYLFSLVGCRDNSPENTKYLDSLKQNFIKNLNFKIKRSEFELFFESLNLDGSFMLIDSTLLIKFANCLVLTKGFL